MDWGVVFLFYIKPLDREYNTRTKLNPGAALEEPEHELCIYKLWMGAVVGI